MAGQPGDRGVGRRSFPLSAVFLVIMCIAVAMAWFLDHRRLSSKLELAEARLSASASRAIDDHSSRTARKKANKCKSPEEFITALRSIKNWYEFADDTADPFVETSIADAALPQLIELLKEDDPEIRQRTLATLGKMKRHPEVIIPAVVPLLHDDVLNTQWHAAFALGQFGPEAADTIPELQSLLADDECGVAAFCAQMIDEIAPSIDCTPRVIELLSNPIELNRENAVQYLSSRNPEGTVEALKAAYEMETAPEVKSLIVESLNAIQRRDGLQRSR